MLLVDLNLKVGGGLNEQGVHHVAMGWVGNVVTLYVDSCVEESGSALSSTYKLIL